MRNPHIEKGEFVRENLMSPNERVSTIWEYIDVFCFPLFGRNFKRFINCWVYKCESKSHIEYKWKGWTMYKKKDP